MSHPTEQLIRDYLNRLSVSARGQLGAEDRRALVIRTRDFIERTTSQLGQPNAMQIAALLSRLGAPAVLVDQEIARLAAVRGETVPQPAGRSGRLATRLSRRSGTASWHWPSQSGSPDLQIRLLNGSATETDDSATTVNGQSPVWVPMQIAAPDLMTATSAGQPEESAGFGPRGPATAGAGKPSAPPAAAGKPAAPAAAAPPAAGTPASPSPAAGRPTWPSTLAGITATAAQPGAALAADIPDAADDRNWLGTGSAAALLSRARADPVEAVAATLLGLGGAVFPPVWLLGAAVAIASRVWDYRDKWIGLAGPVLLLVVGTSLGVTLGNRQASLGGYIHEGWIYADVLSRLAAVLGAYYLVWRLAHPRRLSGVPPWNKPHRVD
jgi:hypothetical protein